jgi:hypothetical protein
MSNIYDAYSAIRKYNRINP